MTEIKELYETVYHDTYVGYVFKGYIEKYPQEEGIICFIHGHEVMKLWKEEAEALIELLTVLKEKV